MNKIYIVILLLLVISKTQAQLSILSDKDEFLNKYDFSSLWSSGTTLGERARQIQEYEWWK